MLLIVVFVLLTLVQQDRHLFWGEIAVDRT